MPVTNFKVIVIGAGPAGLTAAHALTLAGIDFVVLERRETIAPDSGASLVLAPTALRVMEQFGLLDKLLSIGGEISRTKMFDINGNLLGDSTDIADMKKNHGSSPVAFHRAELIQTIYDGLTDAVKLKFLMKQRINNMETDGNGVRVFCADGSVHEGSVVIGADGVHSQTRRLMRNLAVTAEPQVAWDAEHPFSSEYRCMWCSFPRPTVQGNSFETQHKDRSVMYISGHERAWIFLYEKLPEKTNMRADYTDKDVEEFADRFADFPITETLKVKDAFAERLTAGMANLEEGVVKNWYYGRLVLVGDACHKFTPNAGLGFNNGIQDVVAVCNRLHQGIQDSSNGQIEMAALAKMFETYQISRKKDLQGDALRSAHITRMQAWSNTFYYIIARVFSFNFIRRLMINHVAAHNIRKSLILDYAPGPDTLQGDVSWVHRMKVEN